MPFKVLVLLIFMLTSLNLSAHPEACETTVKKRISNDSEAAKNNRVYEVSITDRGIASVEYGDVAEKWIFTAALNEESGANLHLIVASPGPMGSCKIDDVRVIWDSSD